MTLVRTLSLRHALVLDAVASGALGALLAVAGRPLAGPLGLSPALLVGAGLALLPFALALLVLARSASPARAGAWTVVAVNVLWVAGSVAVALAADPSALGLAFVAVQAVAVAAFAALQAAALRRGSGAALHTVAL
jgi:hypothetical protein